MANEFSFPTQTPYQNVSANQQAYNNWQNSLMSAANMAQHMNPSTLAGMALGQVLGSWGGWQAGNWWKNLQEKLQSKLEEQRQLKEARERSQRVQATDPNFIQQQFSWADKQNIPKNQQIAVSPFGQIDRQTYDNYTGASLFDGTLKPVDENFLSAVPRQNESLATYNKRMNLGNWRQSPVESIGLNFQQQPLKATDGTTLNPPNIKFDYMSNPDSIGLNEVNYNLNNNPRKFVVKQPSNSFNFGSLPTGNVTFGNNWKNILR